MKLEERLKTVCSLPYYKLLLSSLDNGKSMQTITEESETVNYDLSVCIGNTMSFFKDSVIKSCPDSYFYLLLHLVRYHPDDTLKKEYYVQLTTFLTKADQKIKADALQIFYNVIQVTSSDSIEKLFLLILNSIDVLSKDRLGISTELLIIILPHLSETYISAFMLNGIKNHLAEPIEIEYQKMYLEILTVAFLFIGTSIDASKIVEFMIETILPLPAQLTEVYLSKLMAAINSNLLRNSNQDFENMVIHILETFKTRTSEFSNVDTFDSQTCFLLSMLLYSIPFIAQKIILTMKTGSLKEEKLNYQTYTGIQNFLQLECIVDNVFDRSIFQTFVLNEYKSHKSSALKWFVKELMSNLLSFIRELSLSFVSHYPIMSLIFELICEIFGEEFTFSQIIDLMENFFDTESETVSSNYKLALYESAIMPLGFLLVATAKKGYQFNLEKWVLALGSNCIKDEAFLPCAEFIFKKIFEFDQIFRKLFVEFIKTKIVITTKIEAFTKILLPILDALIITSSEVEIRDELLQIFSYIEEYENKKFQIASISCLKLIITKNVAKSLENKVNCIFLNIFKHGITPLDVELINLLMDQVSSFFHSCDEQMRQIMLNKLSELYNLIKESLLTNEVKTEFFEAIVSMWNKYITSGEFNVKENIAKTMLENHLQNFFKPVLFSYLEAAMPIIDDLCLKMKEFAGTTSRTKNLKSIGKALSVNLIESLSRFGDNLKKH